MSNKKFFSGNSIRQALIAAASHFDLPADRIAYREVEKKHGFLKAKKRVVIEVDTEHPTQSPVAAEATPTAGAESGAGAAESVHSAPSGRGRGSRARQPEGDGDDLPATEATTDTPPEEGHEAGEAAAAAPRQRRPRSAERRVAAPAEAPEEEPEEAAGTAARGSERKAGAERPSGAEANLDGDPTSEADWEDDEEEGDEGADEGNGEQAEPPRGRPASAAGGSATAVATPEGEDASGGRRRPRRRRGGRGRGAAGAPAAPAAGDADGDLIDLPEHPRRPAERYAEAHGPLADATREALDRVLDVAGLDLSYTVLQGEDRLEVDLTGRDEALLVTEGGELLRAVEHLVPRVVRSLAGESVSVRVDSADFHEIHEEQLRSLAQRVASEVRRSERPRTLEPMSPADRRIIHITLADEPRVTSMSEGSGYFKRVVVKPN